MKKIILLVLAILSSFWFQSYGQSTSANDAKYWVPIITAHPSMLIAPDARSTGMGNVGVVMAGDINSLWHNVSALGFASQQWAVGMVRTPWMTDIVKDMSLSGIMGYYSFDDQGGRRHTIGGTFRYFKIGNTIAFSNKSNHTSLLTPYEYSLDLSYALRVHSHLSVGVALRYAVSDYNYMESEIKSSVRQLVGDLSVTYQRPLSLELKDGLSLPLTLRGAVALNNLGGKSTHDGGNSYQFSPTILRAGIGGEWRMEKAHLIGLYLEATKVLVPAFPFLNSQEIRSATIEKRQKEYYGRNAISSMLASFVDAPNGRAEEWGEVTQAVGAEYNFHNWLLVRLGYHFQNITKGSNAGITVGGGIRWSMMQLDLSYFLAKQNSSPLNNTLRLTLAFSR